MNARAGAPRVLACSRLPRTRAKRDVPNAGCFRGCCARGRARSGSARVLSWRGCPRFFYPTLSLNLQLSSVPLKERGSLELAGVDAFDQDIVERGQLVGFQKTAGLLQDALIALGDLLKESVNVVLRAQEGRVW